MKILYLVVLLISLAISAEAMGYHVFFDNTYGWILQFDAWNPLERARCDVFANGKQKAWDLLVQNGQTLRVGMPNEQCPNVDVEWKD